jgi:microsomal dipeptidase-like Zn-dependent dipeptidase
MLLIDGHLDLAYNALTLNRDLSQSVEEIRRQAAGKSLGTVSLPEMRKGEVGVCLATAFARVSVERGPWSDYNSPEIAYATAQGQLSYYRILESQGQVRIDRSIADHIDHICRLSGNTRHAAIGSDLDGGFGKEQCPDLDTIADLQNVPELLRKRGYSEEDVRQVMHGNWLQLLRRTWSR